MYCIAKVSIQPIYRYTIQSRSHDYVRNHKITWNNIFLADCPCAELLLQPIRMPVTSKTRKDIMSRKM